MTAATTAKTTTAAAKDATAKAPKSATTAKPRPAVPAGYTVRWPHGAFDLLKRDDPKAKTSPWKVQCTIHGTTTDAKSAKDGDALGTQAARPTWCRGCKAAA
jgi:hypothetical protein